jgi:hypothetical protein
MKKALFKGLATALLSTVALTSSYAASITFDLSNPLENLDIWERTDAVHYQSNGSSFGLTVTSVTTSSGFVSTSNLTASQVVYLGEDGLGEANNRASDTDLLDNNGTDFLMLTFTKEVYLDSFSLGAIGLDSDALAYRFNGVGYESQFPLFNAVRGDNSVFDPYADSAMASSVWLIGAFSPRAFIYEDIDLDSFSIDSVTVSEVPVPGSVVFFAPFIALFAWYRRRVSRADPV